MGVRRGQGVDHMVRNMRRVLGAGLASTLLAGLTTAASVIAPAQAATTPAQVCAPGTLIAKPVIAIDSGGKGATIGGKTWISDRFTTGTSKSGSNAHPQDIAGTTADSVYKSWRYGSKFGYNIPVVNGRYLVRLHLAEIYYGARWGAPVSQGPGMRVQNINIEGGAVEVQGLRVGPDGGGSLRAYTLGYETQVRDGRLSIDIARTTDNAAINGVEVLRLVGCA